MPSAPLRTPASYPLPSGPFVSPSQFMHLEPTNPYSSPVSIGPKLSPISPQVDAMDNDDEELDRNPVVGMDHEISGYLGSPTLQPHLYPPNKRGKLPEWHPDASPSPPATPARSELDGKLRINYKKK